MVRAEYRWISGCRERKHSGPSWSCGRFSRGLKR